MTAPGRRGRTGVAVAVCLAVAAVIVVLVLGAGGRRVSDRPGSTSAETSAMTFLEDYLSGDGRVIRHDQGGDTVSEGQAYAMLMAASIGDSSAFHLAWAWTRAHLQQPDHLLAYHWQDGRVIGAEPASDADLDAAHALVLAGARFHEPALTRQGTQIATAILRHETAATRIGPVLVAGPWAVADREIDPSYFSPAAFAALYRATGDRRWRQLEQSSYTIVDELTSVHGLALPPDWARVDAAGHAVATAAPDGASSRFSYDALRVSIRMLGSRTRYGVGMAARMWHFLSAGPAPAGTAYTLAGQVMTAGENPEMLAAAAAAASAASEPLVARSLLARAQTLARLRPTYYGGAILALAQLTIQHADRPGPM